MKGSMKEIFIFQALVFEFGDLLEVWKLTTNAKFQLEIFKIKTAKPTKYCDTGCEYTMVIFSASSNCYFLFMQNS